MKIPFFVQEFTSKMEEAAIDALRNESFVNGESVSKFEEEFARYIGTKYAVSVNSGNSALQLSLMALDIDGNIQKVATPTNSFIASANCIRMTNAQPILTDIDARDGGIDVSSITEKVDAIIPVHIYGNPCDFDSVKTFAEEQKIPIIEDACQAHGATYKNKKVGSLSDVGCFSFYPTKNMTVGGDGGMSTTNNEEVADKIRSIRDNGRKTKNEFDKLGFTMRLNTVNAAIGRIQLKHLDEKNSRRREIVSIYKENLIEDYAKEVINNFNVVTPGSDAKASSLSGGNLQKFVIGREISSNPKLLIISHPTWGIDAGAEYSIRQSLINLAKNGTSIIVLSQDIDELIEITHRMAVIYNGSLSESFITKEIDITKLGLLMGGKND